MDFVAQAYGESVARILALDGNGLRTMPLAPSACASDRAKQAFQAKSSRDLFPEAPSPDAALAGLYLYFSCLDEAHEIAQHISTPEGAYWHGVMHRQEPDAANAAYWYRQVGSHPIFPALRDAAEVVCAKYPGIPQHLERAWNPFVFIDMCEDARQKPGSPAESMAKDIQLAEWQLLFDYCARGPRS